MKIEFNAPLINNNLNSVPAKKAKTKVSALSKKLSNEKSAELYSCNFLPVLNPQAKRYLIDKRIALLKPLKTDEEYSELLEKVLKYRLHDYSTVSKVFTTERIDLVGYKRIDKNLLGLVPYCGRADISLQINEWLTGRRSSDPILLEDNKIADIVRVFEYSLNCLDKKYGKYEGTVYRVGFFNPLSDKQNYSTSRFLTGALEHADYAHPSKKTPYSIIKVKNGHDICRFQKDTASRISLTFAYEEREILLDRKQRFRLVPKEEYSPEDLGDIEMLIKRTLDKNYNDVSEEEMNEISSNIFVWEEI